MPYSMKEYLLTHFTDEKIGDSDTKLLAYEDR